jgi:glutamate N-acetyltransferase / amino-acid N-acetyltransferase
MRTESSLWIPSGFRAAGVKAGIKVSGALDLAVLIVDRPSAAVGTFTTNRVAAAPVQWDRSRVPSDVIRAVVVNSGNANAATGAKGLENVRRTAEAAAADLGCRAEQVLVASTGVIGHQLPMDRLLGGLGRALDEAAATESRFRDATQAILTTDTVPKVVSIRQSIGDASVSLLGFAKGAAMIGPRMATMLAFLLTDAQVAVHDLQSILTDAVDRTFNCVSVDGHTSTNDTVLLLASGEVGHSPLEGLELQKFRAMVDESCESLARMIPSDGEGAKHLITIDVEGCRDREQARSIARAIADSPLVKTAIAGADPNWGRIVSAAGYAGVPFEEPELSLWMNGVLLYEKGAPATFDAAAVSARLKAERDVHLRLLLTHGSASVRFWTCDLTAEYVRLNADYTT